jgi:hypothetical protein
LSHAGEGIFAIARVIHFQSRIRERIGHRGRQRALILDEQDHRAANCLH